MLKDIQIKIVLVFFIVTCIIVTGLGIYFSCTLEGVSQVIVNSTEDINNIITIIGNQITEIKVVTIIVLILFAAISIVIGMFLSKAVISPIDKLLKSAEKIAKGENIELKGNDKNKTEINELVTTFSDVTENMKEKLNEVSRQKKQIEAILLHMTDGIIAFNLEGKVILINPAATRSLSILPEDDNFTKIFKNMNIDINLEKIIYLENWTSSEQRVQIKDKYINLFFAQFKDENDRPAGVIVVVQDITEHVKLDNMRKEFVADVSHELKTPITSIMGYADTLMESEYDKEMQTKFLNVISTEARRMAKLVTDLLALSRYDKNQAITEKTEFDLGELAKKCQEKLQIEINKKKQYVECFVTANVPNVYAEKEGIERVIINILTNSIKYTKERRKYKNICWFCI